MTTARTFGDLIQPASSSKLAMRLAEVATIIGGSLLVAASARIQIPSLPIPFTLQPFAVLLVGAALGSRRGALALIAYLLEGMAGLPVFAAPPFGGLAYLAGPTAGYLLGFVPAAFIVGFLAERRWDRHFLTTAAAMAIGQMVILTCGFAWMSVAIGMSAAFASGVLPFILGDILKIALAALVLPGAWRILQSINANSTRRGQ